MRYSIKVVKDMACKSKGKSKGNKSKGGKSCK